MMLLLVGTLCALVVTASAGYASSSSGAGLYNTNTYGQTYGSKYPYSNSYVGGYAGAGGVPVGPYATPYDFQNQFQHLFAQQLAYQAALQNQIQYNIDAIRNQAYGGGYGYGGYPAYNGASAGSGAYAGSGSYTGGSVGSYGGVSGGQSYGGTSGGRPNYASAGGSVGNGYQHQHAGVYPANPARPNLDSRFGGDTGVTHTRGPGGFVGVSSFSSSSDINGVKNREASTSVNNNGKVTTYYTRN